MLQALQALLVYSACAALRLSLGKRILNVIKQSQDWISVFHAGRENKSKEILNTQYFYAILGKIKDPNSQCSYSWWQISIIKPQYQEQNQHFLLSLSLSHLVSFQLCRWLFSLKPHFNIIITGNNFHYKNKRASAFCQFLYQRGLSGESHCPAQMPGCYWGVLDPERESVWAAHCWLDTYTQIALSLYHASTSCPTERYFS